MKIKIDVAVKQTYNKYTDTVENIEITEEELKELAIKKAKEKYYVDIDICWTEIKGIDTL